VTTVLQYKGRVLDALSENLAALRRRFNGQDQALLDQLGETNTQLARLSFSGPQKKSLEEHQNQIKVLEEKREKLESEIGRRSKVITRVRSRSRWPRFGQPFRPTPQSLSLQFIGRSTSKPRTKSRPTPTRAMLFTSSAIKARCVGRNSARRRRLIRAWTLYVKPCATRNVKMYSNSPAQLMRKSCSPVRALAGGCHATARVARWRAESDSVRGAGR